MGRRHFIYHRNLSYLVIPNLYSCDPNNEDECAKALAMNQLAGVLDDMDLVRWPRARRWWRLRKNELAKFKAEESAGSDTDLTADPQRLAEEASKEPSDMTEQDAALREGAADPQPRPVL